MVGVWVQYLQSPLFDAWLNGGLHRVEVSGRHLSMRMESDVGMTQGIIKPRAITNVAYDGDVWSLVSEWRIGGSGTFRLRRVDDDLFHGYVYIDGEWSTPNLWKRIDIATAFVVTPPSLPSVGVHKHGDP